jgi:hypothetical protein
MPARPLLARHALRDREHSAERTAECRVCLNEQRCWNDGGMEVDLDRARELAVHELERHQSPGLDLVILDDATEEVTEGWFFFWDSRKHQATGSVKDALAGGGPIFVSRSDASTHMIWSGEDWRTALERYRAGGSIEPW